jgi:molybdopterin-guanine dinucleotide biosynthesis protein A
MQEMLRDNLRRMLSWVLISGIDMPTMQPQLRYMQGQTKQLRYMPGSVLWAFQIEWSQPLCGAMQLGQVP